MQKISNERKNSKILLWVMLPVPMLIVSLYTAIQRSSSIRKPLLMVVMLGLLYAICSPLSLSHSLDQVRIGMTRDEVRELVGAPDQANVQGDWIYYTGPLWLSYERIMFDESSRVVGTWS